MTVDIVIVNWNSGTLLKECLESLVASKCQSSGVGQVAVFDNASTDGSAVGLETIPLPLLVRRNPTNVGFGAGCNWGARATAGELILFLNPDTRIDNETLDVAVQFLRDHERVALCGVALRGVDGRIQRSCCRIPGVTAFAIKALGLDRLSRGLVRSYTMSEWDHCKSRQVDHVIGAYYLVRRSVFEALGGFDERFFVYLEDLDLSARLRAAGWECWFLNPPQAFHRGGGSSEQIKATRLYYALRSRLQYSAKHFRWAGAATVWAITLLMEPLVRLAIAAIYWNPQQAAHTLSAYRMLIGWALSKIGREGD